MCRSRGFLRQDASVTWSPLTPLRTVTRSSSADLLTRRWLAFLIDLGVSGAAMTLASRAVSSAVIARTIWLIAVVALEAVMLHHWQATFGKRMFGLRVEGIGTSIAGTLRAASRWLVAVALYGSAFSSNGVLATAGVVLLAALVGSAMATHGAATFYDTLLHTHVALA
jgi:hypothetical protein